MQKSKYQLRNNELDKNCGLAPASFVHNIGQRGAVRGRGHLVSPPMIPTRWRQELTTLQIRENRIIDANFSRQ